MDHNKKLEELAHKIEVLDQLILETEEETKSLNNVVKRLDGFSFAHKEIVSKFEGYVKNQQDELVAMIKDGKLPQPVANLVSASLLGSKKFLETAAEEAERLFFTRQGENFGARARAGKLKKMKESLSGEIASINEALEAAKKSEEAAVNLAAPSEKSPEILPVEPTKNKRKNSRKRPDEVGPLADTVKRLKAARNKKS
jgi:prefoldin subunit 5